MSVRKPYASLCKKQKLRRLNKAYANSINDLFSKYTEDDISNHVSVCFNVESISNESHNLGFVPNIVQDSHSSLENADVDQILRYM